MDNTSHAAASHDHSQHLNPYLIGGTAAASGVMLAPYVLPFFNIGNFHLTGAWAHILEGSSYFAEAGSAYYGTGVAGALMEGLAAVPLLGQALTSSAIITLPGIGVGVAAGVLASVTAVAGLAIGGTLLANWMEKREDDTDKIKWSKVVRYGALASSALIAMPHILGALSLGITAIAFAMGGNAVLGGTISFLQGTLGAPVMEHGAATGLAAMLVPHLATCGSIVASFLGGLFWEETLKRPKESGQAVDMESAPPKGEVSACHAQHHGRAVTSHSQAMACV